MALRQHLEREPHQLDAHLSQVEDLKTRGDAHAYLEDARARLGPGR